jgi:glycosyltransferase involved in cell wall biosynthesis
MEVKICHLTSVHSIDDVRIFVKECTSLASNGFNVTYIACGDTAFEDTKNGVKRISLCIPVNNHLQRMTKRTKAVYKKALSINADIYHFHDPELLPIGKKLKKRGKKVIYDAHEDLPYDILVKEWIPNYLRKICSIALRVIEHYYVRKLDGVVTVIDSIQNRFKNINNNVIVCSNYASLDEFREVPIWKEGKTKICYIGSINKIRGIIKVVEAIEKANVELELAGKFSSLKLEQELKSMNGWKNVNYYGVVRRNEFKAIFDLCFAGIVTFIPSQHNKEASPNKIFEYMAAGLPVIASNLPYAEKVLLPTKSGMCINPESSDEIAHAIRFLIDNPNRAKEMGYNGRKAFEEKFNWQKEEIKLIKFYNSLLNK